MQSLASSRALGRPGIAAQRPRRGALQVTAGLKEVRDRIASVKNTTKITDAMKLVAAAKVRRAQEAVVNGRPFSENLVKVGAQCGRPGAARTDQEREPGQMAPAAREACSANWPRLAPWSRVWSSHVLGWPRRSFTA
jgi:hypothetical protein